MYLSQMLAQFPDLEPFLEPTMARPTIQLEFCRAELNAPTCVIPNGLMIRVIGGAGAPIGIVSPGGGTPASRQKMIAYAHTFAAGPRMLAALQKALSALEALDGRCGVSIQPGSAIHREMSAAVAAAHGSHK